MEHSDTVKVFGFRQFDLEAGVMRRSRYKATRHTIDEHLGGEVMEGTEQDVSAHELDAQGRYHRVATGWGALD